jgi:hypothetical protein
LHEVHPPMPYLSGALRTPLPPPPTIRLPGRYSGTTCMRLITEL